MAGKACNGGVSRGPWRKSTKSGPQGGNCVEFCLCSTDNCIAVRSSKHPEGTVLHFSKSAVKAFLQKAKDGSLENLSTITKVVIADEIVVLGLNNGGFTVSSEKEKGTIEYDALELQKFVEGARDNEFDDMTLEDGAETLAAA